MTIITVFKVMRGDVVLDTHTTQQWLTEESALEKARAQRDRMNTACPQLTPARIVRAFRRNTAKPL